jgi:hypothetical protein
LAIWNGEVNIVAKRKGKGNLATIINREGNGEGNLAAIRRRADSNEATTNGVGSCAVNRNRAGSGSNAAKLKRVALLWPSGEDLTAIMTPSMELAVILT